MPTIDSPCESVLKPLHAIDQITVRSAKHGMIMIIKQSPGKYLPAGHFNCFGKSCHEHFPVVIIKYNRLPSITSCHDMVNSTFKFDPRRKWHWEKFVKLGIKSRIFNWYPCAARRTAIEDRLRLEMIDGPVLLGALPMRVWPLGIC